MEETFGVKKIMLNFAISKRKVCFKLEIVNKLTKLIKWQRLRL